MRTLSLNFRQALFAQESAEVPVFLLTITHDELAEPILLSTDPTTRISDDPLQYATVSRGETYLFAGIELTIPDDQDKAPPAAKLSIANVDRGLIPLARSVSSPPQVRIEAVLASDPDTVEITWPAFDMSNVVYNATALQFDLTIDALVTEPFPALTFTPAHFPGLFF